MARKCEHATAELSNRASAKVLAERLSDKTGILHVTKRDGVMWIATCHLFDDEKGRGTKENS